MLRSIARLKKIDWVLFGSALLLVGFGLAVIYSTSLGSGADGPVADLGNFWKQVAFLAVGAALAIGVSMIDHRALAGYSRLLYGFGIALLGAVLLFGTTIRGTTGWFRVGGIGFQPVEAVKIITVIFFAREFAGRSREPLGAAALLRAIVAFAAVFGLVAMQPDLGSALLLLITFVTVLLVSGVKRSHLVVSIVLFAVAAVATWMFVLKPYQKDRLLVFMDPAQDRRGKGYNVTQSLIAVGSGGVAGKGLGYGSQSQLRFLPERQTDFIFAVIAEELGLMGVIGICALYAAFFYRCYRIAAESRGEFTFYLVLGLTVAIAAEVFVNVGGNLRLLPVTGVTLPFVSYGGSSLLMKFVALGIIQSVAARR